MAEIYDYEEELKKRRAERAKRAAKAAAEKKRRRTLLIHRSIVIGTCVLILAGIITGIVFIAKGLSGGKDDNGETTISTQDISSDTTNANAVVTDGSTPSDASENPTPSETSDASSPTDASDIFTTAPYSETYFDNAVFIGDSVSYGLELYVTDVRASGENCLGKAKFLTSGSLGYANSLWDVSDESVHPSYNGVKMKLEDSLQLINPNLIYILLGSNDVGYYGVDETVQNAQTLLSNIQAVCPNAKIIVLATTPKYKPAEERSNSLNNGLIDEFNDIMSEKCPQWGYTWLDFASQFKISDGSLNPDYCGDPDGMGIHFTRSAYPVWISFFENNRVS